MNAFQSIFKVADNITIINNNGAGYFHSFQFLLNGLHYANPSNIDDTDYFEKKVDYFRSSRNSLQETFTIGISTASNAPAMETFYIHLMLEVTLR